MAYVGRLEYYCVSVLWKRLAFALATEVVFPQKRTGIRITETPGLFNFIVGGSHLENIDEITASQDSVRAFLRDQTSNRSDIKFGEVICYSAYRYVKNMLRENRRS